MVTALGVGLLMLGTRVRDHVFEQQVADLHVAAGRSEERAGALEAEASTNRVEQKRLELALEDARAETPQTQPRCCPACLSGPGCIA